MHVGSLGVHSEVVWEGTRRAETVPTPSTAPASITRLSATHGLEPGGTAVTISGTNFEGVSAVAFGSKSAAGFTSSSATSITAIAPALRAGVYRIAVTTAAGTTRAAKFTVRTFAAEVLRLANIARGTARTCGSSRYKAARPLRSDSTLARVATAHSKDMANHDYFSHESRDGTSPFQRLKRAGYRYDRAGENIVAGFPTPASVVRAWLKSPGHCKNLMNRGYVELGVGFATGGTYGTYWTQDFGNPR